MSRRSFIKAASRSGARVAGRGRALKARLDRGIEGVAWVGGWVGLCALVVCALAWCLGEGHDDLVKWTVLALLLSSLIGWRLVNRGQQLLARRMSRLVAFVLFFVLPSACGLAVWLEAEAARLTGYTPPHHPFWWFVLWYSPTLVAICALAYFKRMAWPRSRPHFWRAAGVLALLAPYGLLFAYLVLHLRVEALEGPLHETLTGLGRYSLVIQLLLAYFVGNVAE